MELEKFIAARLKQSSFYLIDDFIPGDALTNFDLSRRVEAQMMWLTFLRKNQTEKNDYSRVRR